MHEINLNDLIKSIYTKPLIILILFFWGISCTFQNESDIPEYVSGIQNLVVIEENADYHSSIEFKREAILDNPNATRTWFHDVGGGGDFAFGGVDWFAGLEIDDSGRIYVGNRPATTIQIFDSTGLYLTNIGREGNGPGEFNGILDIKIQSNQLFAFDYFQFRTSFFSLDSFKLDEVKNAYLNRAPNIDELTGWHAQQVRLVDADTFLVGYMDDLRNANFGTPHYNLDKERPVRYYLVDREGKVLTEMLFELMDHKKITADVGGRHLFNLSPVPFLNMPLISISNDGLIFSANSETSLIKMYDPNGDYIRAFYITLEKKPLLRHELIDMYTEDHVESQNLLIHAELPEEWPSLGDLLVDDENRLWVSTIPDSENLMYEWWVLQDTGQVITKFRWPKNRSIEKIKNGYIYVRDTEESTGLQTIAKYRIEIEKI
jgi:hypothetical protein